MDATSTECGCWRRPPLSIAALRVSADDRHLTITGDCFEYVIDQTNGLFATMQFRR